MTSSNSGAASILMRQYKELTDPKKAIPSFHIELEEDNIFLWKIGVMVLNEDSVYHGGYFKAQMRFPPDFPFSPPTFRFTPAIYHPNVYKDGRLCISILHQGGDPTGDESDAETWSPAQSVETVLISIVSLLDEPNPSSPANVDAGVDWRKKPDVYKQKVALEVARSKRDIPENFVMPSSEKAYVAQQVEQEEEMLDDDFFYTNSEADDDDIGELDDDMSDEALSDEDSIMDDLDNNDNDIDDEEEELSNDENINVPK